MTPKKNTPVPGCISPIPNPSSEKNPRRAASRASLVLIAALGLLRPGSACGQDRTLVFGVADTGVSKAITEWGLDTAWPSPDNMRRGIIFMGADQVDVVRVAFPVNAAPVNGALAAAQLADLTNRVNIANQAGAGKPVTITPDNGAGVDAWFRNGGTDIVPSRWVQTMEASVRALAAQGKTVVSASPFNEPDYNVSPVGQGTVTNLYDILGLLQTSADFSGVPLAGASTLNCDQANTWYNVIKARVNEGTTHQLAGSFDNYVSFYQNVRASGDRAMNEELHNVCEAIVGVEYGLQTGIWWGSAELARASFVKACQGMRLAYAEHRPNWTAAAVYRAPGGAVQAFLGSSERQATTTSYRFVSKDRDVFFDGNGPQRDYTVIQPGGTGYQVNQPNAERVVNITWGADVQPAINGRYILVNRNSSKVMEVAGASTADGADIVQNSYTGAPNQQWDVAPMASTSGGDYSYYTFKAVHSGKATDIYNWSFDDGGDVKQWTSANGANQVWFLEYVSDGWFRIRNRWSGKCLDVDNGSTADGANIFQWSSTGGLNQQWRLLPVGAAIEFTAPSAPTGVVATANAVSVSLSWTASTATDLAGYNVLRSDTSGGPYSLVARGLTTNAFTDKSANQARAYYYVVQAADKSLNRSGNSSQVAATPTGAAALVARLNFDGNASDVSGNANHATINGNATYGAARVGTNALSFDGSTQFVNLPSDLANFSQLTVAAWVYWNGGSAWQRIFDFGNGTDQYLFLTPNASGAGLRFGIKNGGAEQVLNASTLATGQWVHVAVTLGTSSAQLYVNGAQVATSTAITIKPSDFKPVLNYIGKSQWADPLFSGRIDDFRVYNYALAASAVAELATGVPAGTFRLQNRANGKMVDNYGATTDGASVLQYDSGPSNNQKWVVSTLTGGYRKLQCVTGGKFLDTLGNTADGSVIGQWTGGSSNNQQWTFTYTDSGYYKVVNRANGKCLDTGGSTTNGTAMQNWGSGSSYNQQWRLVD